MNVHICIPYSVEKNLGTGFIYKITNPTGKTYIGQTKKSPKERIKFYRRLHCKRQIKLYHSILKYGWDAHSFEIIFSGVVSKEELNDLEIKYIEQYRSFNSEMGMNLTSGGIFGKIDPKHHEATRNRMTGRKVSEATRQKLRDANLGKKHSAETILKRTIAITGKKRTEESRRKYSESKKGIKFSASHIQAMKNVKRSSPSEITRQKMSIAQKGKEKKKRGLCAGRKVLDTTNNTLFPSLTIACAHYGYKYETVKAQLNGINRNKTSLVWAA